MRLFPRRRLLRRSGAECVAGNGEVGISTPGTAADMSDRPGAGQIESEGTQVRQSYQRGVGRAAERERDREGREKTARVEVEVVERVRGVG